MIRRTNALRAAWRSSSRRCRWRSRLRLRRGRPRAAPAPQSAEFFEARIRPVLAANCYDCHADERMGGLRLDSREGLLKGGGSGPAIVPGDPDKSLLIQAVRQTRRAEDAERRTPERRTRSTRWPSGCARARHGPPPRRRDFRCGFGTAAARRPDRGRTRRAPAYVIKPEQRAFWSFQPLRMPPVPAVSHTRVAEDRHRSLRARAARARRAGAGRAPPTSAR